MKTYIITGAYFASSSGISENYTIKEEHREQVVFDLLRGRWSCSCKKRNCRHIPVAKAIADAEGRGKKK